MSMDKKLTSLRISDEAYTLREQLAQELGVNRTAVIELAIRELANRVARDRQGDEGHHAPI